MSTSLHDDAGKVCESSSVILLLLLPSAADGFLQDANTKEGQAMSQDEVGGTAQTRREREREREGYDLRSWLQGQEREK